MKLLFLKRQRVLVILALACELAGCVDKPKVQGEPYHSNLSAGTKQIQEIDWNYNEAINTCKIPPRTDLQPGSDLRPDIIKGLSYRNDSLLFKRLKGLIAGMNNCDYVLCETCCLGWETYDFILVSRDLSKEGSLICSGSGEGVKEFSSNIKFDTLKKFVQESDIISIPPNLENFSTDDGTYCFYIFHFDGKIYQTFCYAPKPYGKTSKFYAIYEKLSELVKHPKSND